MCSGLTMGGSCTCRKVITTANIQPESRRGSLGGKVMAAANFQAAVMVKGHRFL
jgi:hypothetical protein